MSEFRFDPSSMFLHMAEPLGSESAARDADERERVVEMGAFLARYLHERIHWIQHFATFSGISQILAREFQRGEIEGLISEHRGVLTEESFPLRETLTGEPIARAWDDLELFSAVMAGERGLGHYRHDYFGIDWSEGLKRGCHLFSRICYGARAYGFDWPPLPLVEALHGIRLDRVEVVRDDDRRILGATSLFELQAELGELHKFAAHIDQNTDLILAFNQQMQRRPAQHRDSFYELSQLDPYTWRSDLICNEILYCACNMQARLFLPHIGNAESFSEISAFHHFAEMSARVRRVAADLNAIKTDDPRSFFDQSRPMMQEVFGCDMLSMIFGALERWGADADYHPAEIEPEGGVDLDTPSRLQFVASKVTAMVAVACEEPLFVLHPGMLYTIDRTRFGELYRRVSHVVEYREESGFVPAPHFSRSGSIGEYMRQIACGTRGALTRLLAHGGFDRALAFAKSLDHVHPDIRPYHLLAARAGINGLGLPEGLEARLMDQLGEIEFGPAPTEAAADQEIRESIAPPDDQVAPRPATRRASVDLTEGASDEMRLVTIIRGLLDDGEPFWAWVAIKPSMRWEYKAAEIERRVDIKEFDPFGEILVSGTGDDPPEEVTKMLSEFYGYDLTEGLSTNTFL